VSGPVHDDLRSDPLLASAEEAAASALRELPEALVVVFDDQLRFVLTAGQVLARLGDPGVCREGRFIHSAFPEETWTAIGPLFESALQGETRSREIWTSDQRHCLMVDVGPLRVDTEEAGGRGLRGAIAVLVDITARRRADALARYPGHGFEEVFEQAPIATGLLDIEGRWLLANRRLCDITGYTTEELVGTRFDGIVHPGDVNNDLDQRARLQAGEIAAYQTEKRYFDAAGETVAAILSMSLVRDRDGTPLHYVAQMQDISERRRLEDDVRRLADHDELTGLRNRRLFEHDLALQFARTHRYGEKAGLMLIDVDAFRQINERHGQAVGDEALKALARALRRRLRQTDLIARVGADEFAVLLPHIDPEGLGVVADGLACVIAGCGVDIGATVLHPSASIGYVLIDRRTASTEQALAEAYRAMQLASYGKHRSPARAGRRSSRGAG
jgi:diguanylate cyclase (GGDEF)-like protein/PAS domain S-box-containing protein